MALLTGTFPVKGGGSLVISRNPDGSYRSELTDIRGNKAIVEKTSESGLKSQFGALDDPNQFGSGPILTVADIPAKVLAQDRFIATTTELADGTRIDTKTFDDLPESVQKIGKDSGFDALKEASERWDAGQPTAGTGPVLTEADIPAHALTQDRFTAANVELAGSSFVAQGDFDKASFAAQQAGKKSGLDALNAQTAAERAATLNRIDEAGGLSQAILSDVPAETITRADAIAAGFTNDQIDDAIRGEQQYVKALGTYEDSVRANAAQTKAIATGQLVEIGDGTLVDGKEFATLPSAIKTIGLTQGVDALTAAVDAYNQAAADEAARPQAFIPPADSVLGGDGQYIATADFDALSKDDQDVFTLDGYTALVDAIDKRDAAAQAAFERDNIKLDTGEYVNREDYNNLSDPQQRTIMAGGVAALTSSENQGGFASLADVRKLQRLWGESKDDEARAFQAEIDARRPLLTGVEAARQSGRAALSLVPVVGTIVDWNRMNNIEKGVSFALDAAFILGPARAGKALFVGKIRKARTLDAVKPSRELITAKKAITDVRAANELISARVATLPKSVRGVARAQADAVADYYESSLRVARAQARAAKLTSAAASEPRRVVGIELKNAVKAAAEAKSRVETATPNLVRKMTGGREVIPTDNGPLSAGRLTNQILDTVETNVAASVRATPRSRAAILREAKKVRAELSKAAEIRATEYASLAENQRVTAGLTSQKMMDLQRRYTSLHLEMQTQRITNLGNIERQIDDLRSNINALVRQQGLSKVGELPLQFKYRAQSQLAAAQRELAALERRAITTIKSQPAIFDIHGPRPKRPLSPIDYGSGPLPRTPFTILQDELVALQSQLKLRPDDPKILARMQEIRNEMRTASRSPLAPGFGGSTFRSGIRIQGSPTPELTPAISPVTTVDIAVLPATMPSVKPTTKPLEVPTPVTPGIVPGVKPSTRTRVMPTTTPRVEPTPTPGLTPIGEPSITPGIVTTPGINTTPTITITTPSVTSTPDTDTDPGIKDDTGIKDDPKDDTSTKTDAGTPTKTPTPTRTTTARDTRERGTSSSTGRPPPFRLPNGDTLPEGDYPKIIAFKQGLMLHTVNLETGRRDVTRAVTPGKPQETFTVLATMKVPPTKRRKRFDQGVVDYVVSPDEIYFVADTKSVRTLRTRPPFRDSGMKTRR